MYDSFAYFIVDRVRETGIDHVYMCLNNICFSPYTIYERHTVHVNMIQILSEKREYCETIHKTQSHTHIFNINVFASDNIW